MSRRERGAARTAKVVMGGPPVRAENDVVRMTEDVIEETSAAGATTVVTTAAAARCLHDRFGTVVEAEYVPGKTLFRDALSASLEISQLAAEDLCDELERAGGIVFIQNGEGFGWHIHAEDDLPGMPE